MKSMLVILLVCLASTVFAQDEKKPGLNIDFSGAFENVLEEVNKGIQSALAKLLENLKNVIPSAIVGRRDLQLEAKFEQLKNVLESVKAQLSNKLKALYEELAAKLKDLYPKLLENLPHGKREVDDALEQFKANLAKLAEEALGHFKGGLAEFFKNGLDKLKDLVKKPETESLKRDVVKNAQQALQNIIAALQGHASNIGEVLKGHAADAVAALQLPLNQLKDQLIAHGINAAQSVVDAIAQAAKSVGGK